VNSLWDWDEGVVLEVATIVERYSIFFRIFFRIFCQFCLFFYYYFFQEKINQKNKFQQWFQTKSKLLPNRIPQTCYFFINLAFLVTISTNLQTTSLSRTMKNSPNLKKASRCELESNTILSTLPNLDAIIYVLYIPWHHPHPLQIYTFSNFFPSFTLFALFFSSIFYSSQTAFPSLKLTLTQSNHIHIFMLSILPLFRPPRYQPAVVSISITLIHFVPENQKFKIAQNKTKQSKINPKR